MKRPNRTQSGSILVWTVLTIAVLSILGAEILRVVSIKHQSALQTATWQEALLAAESGIDLAICNVGQMMYREAPDVPPGKILNLPMPRLNALRRAVFKEILNFSQRHEHSSGSIERRHTYRRGFFQKAGVCDRRR